MCQLFSGFHNSTCILTPESVASIQVMTADCRKMEEGSDELERKIEKLNAQLARQTARAEKVHWRSGEYGECPGAGGVGVVVGFPLKLPDPCIFG